MKSNRGFTLVELMIYVGLTAIVMGLFGAILITVTRITGQQNSSTQITSELSFIMTTIKRHIHEADQIMDIGPEHIALLKDGSTNPPTLTLVHFLEAAGSIMLTETGPEGQPPAPLSTSKISIDDMLFEQLTDTSHPSSTIIRITITASASTTNPQNQATRTITSTASPFVLSQ